MDGQTALRRAIRAAGPEVFLACWADPDQWFSEDPMLYMSASLECFRGCPVRAQCLTAALERDEGFGVWGGVKFPRRRDAAAAAWMEGEGSVVAVPSPCGGR